MIDNLTTEGIPQSSAPPSTVPAFGENPWDVDAREQRAEQIERYRGARAKIDGVALDPDSYFKGKDMGPGDATRARMLALNSAFLDFAQGENAEPVPIGESDLSRKLIRQRIARERFDGRGGDSEESFHAEIVKDAQGRKDRAEIYSFLGDEAARGAVIGSASKENPATWEATRDAMRAKPGYDKADEAEYFEAWHETQRASREAIADFAPELGQVWEAMKRGGGGTFSEVAKSAVDGMLSTDFGVVKLLTQASEELGRKDAAATAFEIYSGMQPEQRQRFMGSLGTLARSLPKDQKAEFWKNLNMSGGRAVDDLARNAGETAVMHAIESSAVPMTVVGASGGQVQYDSQAGAQARKDSFMARRNFAADVRKIERADYAPTKFLSRDSDDIFSMRTIEEGIYGAPGAIASSAMVAVPGIGFPAMFLSMEGAAYDSLRDGMLQSGATEVEASAFADKWKSVAALPEAALEKLQARAIMGKLPVFEKTMQALGDKIASRSGRFALRVGAAAVQESTIEKVQDLISPVVQEIAGALSEEVPDVQWTGPGGVLDGFGQSSASMLITMLPLAIIGAVGGVSTDARARAFAEASPTIRQALGISAADSAAIDEAAGRGMSSLRSAVGVALERADNGTEETKAARIELEAQLAEQKAAAEEAQAAGIVPKFTRTADGWTVTDSATGGELGTATDAAGAFRIAAEHSRSINLKNADQVAYLATMLQAAELTTTTDTETRTTAAEVSPFERVTPEQMAATSEADFERVMAQAAARARMSGADAGIAQSVFGQSVTKFKQGVRETVNKLFGGASVLTVFHEETHGFFREALAAGRLTQESTVAVIRTLESVLAGKATTDGQQLQFLPTEFDSLTAAEQAVALDEAVSELMEAEILRTRKSKGNTWVPGGIITRNLTAMARMAPGATKSFSAFADAVRDFFGLTFARAVAMKKGIRDGTISEKDLDDFKSKLFGLEAQDEFDGQAAETTADILGEGDPFSIGPAVKESFTTGRTTITPTAETQVFEGAEGSPSVIGPAAFSIGAWHGTPHKVDKFRTANIGTGEGAQAYGWGLYYAGLKAVASSYLKAGRNLDVIKDSDGKWFATDGAKTIAGPFDDSAAAQAAVDAPTGNLYRVTLDVEESDLLDWDKPLSEQSEKARELLPLIGLESRGTAYGWRATLPMGEAYNQIASDFEEGRKGAGDRMASEAMMKAGIPGMRYLDGNSRNGSGWKITPASETVSGKWMVKSSDYNSKGLHFDTEAGAQAALAEKIAGDTYNYVMFDESLIKITEENGMPVETGPSFAMGPARMADLLARDAIARIADPRARAVVMRKTAVNMEALKRETDEIGTAFGKPFVRGAIEDPRKLASINREARVRETFRRAELEDAVHAKHQAILSQPELAKLKSQPIHEYLSDPTNPLLGRLMSKTQAIKRQWFDESKHGDYDGAANISRTMFGGSMAPDQAAQELYDNGLISQPTPDAMWQAMEKESNSVAKMKVYAKAAADELKAAAATAKKETADWKADRLAQEKADYSPKARLLRAMAMLEGIVNALPVAERGKVTGYMQLAKLESDEARLKYLRGRIDKADKVVEAWLSKEYDRMLKKIFERAVPTKGKAGEKPKGKIGADAHSLFRVLEAAWGWSAADGEAHAVGLESLIAAGDLTPAQEAHATLEAGLVRQVSGWADADAAARADAVKNISDVFDRGYFETKLAILFQKEDREIRRKQMRKDTGKQGAVTGRAAMEEELKGIRGLIKNAKEYMLGLLSFEQMMEHTFGKNSKEARAFADMERHAGYAKIDKLAVIDQKIEDLFRSLTNGDALAAEKLRFALSDRAQAIGADGKEQTPIGVKLVEADGTTRYISEMEAVDVTLQWRQTDGKRHMEGRKDENGLPTGTWHYTQADVDAVEKQLSPAALAVRQFLSDEIATEWAEINPLFKQLNHINLPNIPNYWMISVKPEFGADPASIDPVTGMPTTGSGFTPGSLKSRGQSISEPDFRDALHKFLGHKRQIEHWLAYAHFSAELSAILGDRKVANSIEEKAGREAVSVLRKWNDYFAKGGNVDAASALASMRGLGKITNRLAATALVGRVSVLAIQSTQLGAAAYHMPVGAYVKRLAKLSTGQLGYGAAIKSAYIQRRMKEMPPFIRQAMDGLSAGNPTFLKHHVTRMGGMIGGADALFTAGTYAMILDYQLAEMKRAGLTGPEAERAAHDETARLVDQIAQPVRPGTRSLVENLSTHPAMRLGWAFASEARQKMAFTAFGLISPGSAMHKAKVITVTMMMQGAMAAILRAALRDMRDGGDDEFFDEKNWGVAQLGLATLTGPLKGIPFLGDAAQGAIYGMAGQYLPEGNLLSGVGNAGKASVSVFDMIAGNKDAEFEKVLKDSESIIGGLGAFSQTAASAGSVAHVVRDVYNIIKTGVEAATD